MRNLLRFLLKYNFQILFIILELFALILVFRVNPVPRSRMFQAVEATNSWITFQFSRLDDFLGVRSENRSLIQENARLRSYLTERNIDQLVPTDTTMRDSLEYDYLPARVVNNTINRQNNYLTLERGARDGIEPDMGVVGPEGIVGVVRNVSDRFCVVLSLLNSGFRSSAALYESSFFGSVRWDGLRYREAQLTDIPSHVRVSRGDTVVTSGYSSIYPPGEMIGTILSSESNPEGNFQTIRIRLSQDLKRLTWVYIVRNRFQEEQRSLEAMTNDEQ